MLEMPFQMPIADLMERGEMLARTGQRVSVLWQKPESLAFVARGREYRSEFHINPSDELMYMIKGEMNLHYRDTDASEKISVLQAGLAVTLDLDDQVTVAGASYRVIKVDTDPAGAAWTAVAVPS